MKKIRNQEVYIRFQDLVLVLCHNFRQMSTPHTFFRVGKNFFLFALGGKRGGKRGVFWKFLKVWKFFSKSFQETKRIEKGAFVAPSLRRVPQLYSPKASYIATQLYLGYAQVIFASRVLGANIISLKRQVSISLCVITQNITVRPVSQYHLIFLFLR